ncbi:MAG: VWA domain-containing protein [Phycisphaeraceae bacterium]|nr:VWA domain-containing protein [Phycisphaeraceae bacterium]
MTTQPHDQSDAGGDNLAPPFAQGDELDTLLRDWHRDNRERAASGRDRLLAALRAEDAAAGAPAPAALEFKPAAAAPRSSSGGRWVLRLAPLAIAALVALAFVAPFILPPGPRGGGAVALASVGDTIMCPEGGMLEAYDAAGNSLGPCELRHTDVAAEISGHVARVTLTQTFHNPHKDKIEAVYTFPLSHRGAVDRMSMTIGDRVIVGEVKERDLAREIYEAARDQGLVAALTEQERPNIFTQSVANIEPGATIAVTLSYVEFVEEKDGEFSFVFPTVVGPRYIPGTPSMGDRLPSLPDGLKFRRGLVLLSPASIDIAERGPGFARSERNPDITLLAAAIRGATPIEPPVMDPDNPRWYALEVRYADGTTERGMFYPPSLGHIGARWFTIESPLVESDDSPRSGDRGHGVGPGEAFGENTDQVPDAASITPMPLPPGTRAGHDLSISVTIDTGGPGILGIESPLHKTTRADTVTNAAGLPRRTVISLERLNAIPNRDFVLTWKQSAEHVTDQVFTHTGPHGNFFALMLRPPARVDDAMAVPRELVFVLDTSGSMRGFPMEKSREVVDRALSTMRGSDTFNVITFSGATRVLWPSPRPATIQNIAEARQLLARLQGGGGTEMMTAIEAALRQAPVEEDRVRPLRIAMFFTDGYVGNDLAIIDAVKRHRGTTRVFTFGIGNSVNRLLLDSMAQAGGGAAEYVLLESDADAAVERLTRRTRTPVLTDIRVQFTEQLPVLDVLPSLDNIPDLFDEQPLMILGRYTGPGEGAVVIRGNTAAGPWRRVIALSLPERQPEHDTIATMWARAKIEQIKSRDLAGVQQGTLPHELRQEIVRIGERFGIMSEYTSFVAVDKLRMTIAGKPRLVNVPIELPAGTDYSGFFGTPAQQHDETWRTRAVPQNEPVPPIVRVQVQADWLAETDAIRMERPAEASRGDTEVSAVRMPAPTAAPPAPGSHPEQRGQAKSGAYAAPTTPPPQAAAPARGALPADSTGNRADGRNREEAMRRNLNLFAAGQEARMQSQERGRADMVGRALQGRSRTGDDQESRPAYDHAGVVGTQLLNTVPVLIDDVAGSGRQVNSVVAREQVVLRVAQLAQQQQSEQARELACGLAQVAPDYPVAIDLCNVLNEAKAPPEAQLKQVAAFAEQARRDLHEQARRAELRRRIDERLWLYVFGESQTGMARLGVEAAVCNNLSAAEAMQMGRNAAIEIHELGGGGEAPMGEALGALVTVLVSDTGEAMLSRLRSAGLRIESAAPAANVVIGVIPLGRLGELALTDGVRRVEPTAQE